MKTLRTAIFTNISTVIFFMWVFGAALSGVSAQESMRDDDTSAGEALYSSCAQCHQTSGAGRAYAYPPLAGHVPELISADGGRAYLINVLLYGVQGEIIVDGASYNGVMPGWSQFSDEEMASLLNYLSVAWDNIDRLPEDTPAFSADEVAAERETGLNAAQVYELRRALELSTAE